MLKPSAARSPVLLPTRRSDVNVNAETILPLSMSSNTIDENMLLIGYVSAKNPPGLPPLATQGAGFTPLPPMSKIPAATGSVLKS